MGYNLGSNGSVTVIGTGSTWNNSGSLYVGKDGSGTLTVSDGGIVTIANTLYASLDSLFGNGTISTKAAILDADIYCDALHGTNLQATFGNGGIISINTDSDLGVGYKSNGSLRIADGHVVSSRDGYLGYKSGSTGTATVTGSGSNWTTSHDLWIGYAGNGEMNIESGGQVNSAYCFLKGKVNVTGPGSKWTTTEGIFIHKTLNIQAGAEVISGYTGTNSMSGDETQIGGYNGVTATATVTGIGSKWTNSEAMMIGHEGNGALIITSGGQVEIKKWETSYLGESSGFTGTLTVNGANSKLSCEGSLYIGKQGNGILNIEDGGQIVGSSVCLISGSGVAKVNGTGSQWTCGVFSIEPNGSLTVSDGGKVVVNGTLFTSLNYLYGNGAITARGAVLDVDFIFDAEHGLQKTFSFGTGGVLNITPDYVIGAGYAGKGSLKIADGITVKSTAGYLGYISGSNGTATVSGTGSKWSSSGPLLLDTLVLGH